MKKYRCGVCGEVGHTRPRCPTVTGVSARRCNQCNQPLKEDEERRNCDACRRRLVLWNTDREEFHRTRPQRTGLTADGPLRVRWIAKSRNKKLGPIPACFVSSSTCPPSCKLYGNGCYAEQGPLKRQWVETKALGLSWSQFLEQVASLPERALWRYGIAGDLPGRGDEIDQTALAELADANARSGARGFSFTHKPLTEKSVEGLREAAMKGFTVNISANSVHEIDDLSRFHLPMVSLVAANAPDIQRTLQGRKVVVCPAERGTVQCRSCQLCAQSERKNVIGFRAHGTARVLADRVAQGTP